MHRKGFKYNRSDWPQKYVYNYWRELITDFISQLNPKPNIFMFNAGFWPHNFHDENIRKITIKAISDLGMISIYKTTSKTTKNNDTTTMEKYEKQMCRLADYCFDLSWTAYIPTECIYDNKHFANPIYSWMNIAFFNLLQQIEHKET